MPLVFMNDAEYLEVMEVLDDFLHRSLVEKGYARTVYDRCAVMYGLPWEEGGLEEDNEAY